MKKRPKNELIPDATIDRVDEREEFKKLRDWVSEKKIQDGVNARVRAICITSTSAGITACLYIGKLLYDNALAVSAGVRAFWEVFSKGPPQ